MRRAVACAVLSLALLAGACGTRAPVIVGRVADMRVRVEPLADGSFRVREHFEIEPDAAGLIRFARLAETAYADGLVSEAVEVDGRRVSSGSDGLSISAQGNRVEIQWEASAAPGRPRRLEIALIAKSGVAVTQPRAGLTWPVLAAGRGFDVARVHVDLVLPANAAIYQGTGMVEAGWSVARTTTGIQAVKEPVADAESGTLAGAFDFDRTGVSDPVWERNLDRRRQFLPAFLAGALFFLVIGAGTLIILRAQYPSRAALARRPGTPVPSHAERATAARGLVIAGMAGAAMAAACAVVAGTVLAFFGPWVQLIPASMAFVSLIFVASARRLLLVKRA